MKYFFSIVGKLAKGSQLLEASCPEELQPLGIQFRQFLWDTIPEDEEWPNTTYVFEYLSMDVVEVYLSEKSGSGSKSYWELELIFSGCGGMAETISLLCSHWAECWYSANRKEIDAQLKPFGFIPIAKQPEVNRQLFVPIRGGGYAAHLPGAGSWDSNFEADVSTLDSCDDAEELLAELEKDFGKSLSDGKCRCQLCMPNLRLPRTPRKKK